MILSPGSFIIKLMKNTDEIIYFMRHGQSMATLDPTLFGRADPVTIPLTQFGYQQTVTAGEKFRDHLLARSAGDPLPLLIYYSPHLRIKQSAVGFLEGLDNQITIAGLVEDARIREREHGTFDGLDSNQQYQ